MTQVFVHPDGPAEPRTDRIVAALRAEGLEVRPTGPSHDPNGWIFLLFWTHAFAESEAASAPSIIAAAEAGRLVSVLVEKATLPRAIPLHPVIDLVGWRGSTRNAFFRDLVSVLRALQAETPPPAPRGPYRRFLKRLLGGLTLAAVAGFVVTFGLNLLSMQNEVCSIGFAQPRASDFCGRFGFGGKPTRTERLAWEARPVGSCEALRDHIRRFPDGALHGLAADYLEASRKREESSWTPDTHRTVFSGSISPEGAAEESIARDASLDAGRHSAEASCQAFAATDYYRLLSVDLEVTRWDCFENRSGHFCGFDGFATCKLERLERRVVETCEVAR